MPSTHNRHVHACLLIAIGLFAGVVDESNRLGAADSPGRRHGVPSDGRQRVCLGRRSGGRPWLRHDWRLARRRQRRVHRLKPRAGRQVCRLLRPVRGFPAIVHFGFRVVVPSVKGIIVVARLGVEDLEREMGCRVV